MDLGVISNLGAGLVPNPSRGIAPRPSSHNFSRRTSQEFAPRGLPKPRWQPPRPSSSQGIGRLHVVRAGKTTGSAAESAFQPGDLVEFQKDKERSSHLGLVQQPNGKKDFWVLDKNLRRTSIQPRQVIFKLPGGPFTEAQLLEICAAATQDEQEARQASEDSTPAATSTSTVLADAWEMAVADNVPTLSLADLAGLVLEDESCKNLYRMYKMLAADRLYFRQLSGKGHALGDLPQYQPRTPVAVEEQRAALAAEALVREDESAWATQVRAALTARRRNDQPKPEDWAAGRHAKRIAALKELAVQDASPLSSETLKLAQQSLALAGIVPPSSSTASTPASGSIGVSPLSEAATNLLVDVRAWRRHEPVAALRRGVSLTFPDSLEAEAQALLEHPPPDTCADLRVDLTHLQCYTIDDAGTTEIDDGLSVEFLDSSLPGAVAAAAAGQREGLPAVRFWMHVADPTRWLTPRGPLCDMARTRSRTLYFPWGSVPMFPRCLAEGPFSLRQGQACDAISVGVTLNVDGSIRDTHIVPSRVHVTHQLTYDQADQLLSGRAPQEQQPPAEGQQAAAPPPSMQALAMLREAAQARNAYRDSCGAIEIPLPEAKVQVAWSQLDSGRPHVTIQRLSQKDSASRGLVAEMMILAGEAAGNIGAGASLPLPFRCQPPPHLPPADELEAIPEGVCRGYHLRRRMTRSAVSHVPARHSSLGLDAYVQVTSPIRRWADIVAHFNLKAHLTNQPPPFSAAEVETINAAASSDRIRNYGVAEKDEEMYWVTEYFRQRQASRSQHQWPATVLGWQREDLKLAAVLLDELGMEVVVKVDVDVHPGDFIQLALLEARPVSGVLRFYVTEYLSVGGHTGFTEAEGEEAEGADAQYADVPSIEELFEQMEAAAAAAGSDDATDTLSLGGSSDQASVMDSSSLAGSELQPGSPRSNDQAAGITAHHLQRELAAVAE